ncbi:V-type ATP synthase subunit I [Spirochaetota bacterium]
MKKIFLVVLDSLREGSLENLRDSGVMHLELTKHSSDKMTELKNSQDVIERAISFLPELDGKAPKEFEKNFEKATETAFRVTDLKKNEDDCNAEIVQLKLNIDKYSSWGDFKLEDISYLSEKGINIKLFELTEEQKEQLPDDVQIFTVNSQKNMSQVAVIYFNESLEFPLEDTHLPEMNLSEMLDLLSVKNGELEKIQNELMKLSMERPLLQWSLGQLDEKVDFEDAVTGMENEGRVAYIKGYVPENKIDKLKKDASKNGWGVLISEPEEEEEDQVPTLVENPKWVDAIKPVFNLLGTVPGYKEFDISLWFLLFFSVFWAMILGDAGYGLIFLVLTIVLRLKFRKASFEPFLLLFITSISTIAWGAITGNWFGVEGIAKHSMFSWMVIPSIASFTSMAKGNPSWVIMYICFFIGVVQLTIAHLISFVRYFPSLKAYSEIGWIGVLWGLYFLIQTIVLKVHANPYTTWLIGAGLGIVIIFSEQEGNFIKGLKKGFANLILTLLGGVGFFSDIVSYVRLFAVGLATLEVAKSFNAMASGPDAWYAYIISALILFFGHGLNIILGCMSLIVHGVRLNMLEFSGHLNMEWSGVTYKPFKKKNA